MTISLKIKSGKSNRPTNNITITNDVHPPKKSIKHQESLLVSLMKNAMNDDSKVLNSTQLTFEVSTKAAERNSTLIAAHGFSIRRLLSSEPNTILTPGSEFRSLNALRPLFKLHPKGDYITSIVENGVKYRYIEDFSYPETDRKSDISHACNSNINNKSTFANPNIVDTALEKEVKKGWSFVLPKNFALLIDDPIGCIPLSVAQQWTMDSTGKPVIKYRLAQDCSQARPSGFSINKNIDIDSYSCQFGYCLHRILLRILFLRQKYPTTPIGISKHDMDSAYRRLHVHPDDAILECWTWREYLVVNTRLPFGSAPAASDFSVISDFIADLSQAMINDETWDPDSLKSPMTSQIPLPSYAAGQKTKARPLLYDIDCPDIYIDVYIDDLITLATLSNDNINRARNAIPLALDCIFRRVSEKELNSRPPILAYDKLLAEGNLSETRTVLGWVIDTSTLRMHLSPHKAQRYLTQINEIIFKAHQNQLIKGKDLEKLLGKLLYVAQIAIEGKYFMSRLRYRLKKIQSTPTPPIHSKLLKQEEINDLMLWKEIIHDAEHKGRNVNRIANTIPDFGCVSDACQHGLGGWTNFGIAWRYALPSHLLGIFSINILETIAAYWTIKLTINVVGSCKILAKVDSKSAQFWIHRPRFHPDTAPVHDSVCRLIGTMLRNYDSAIILDHTKGETNVLADSLSRDSHIPLIHYLPLLKQHLGQILPTNFEIIEQNSPELTSFLESLASMLPSIIPKQIALERSKIMLSVYGKHTARVEEPMIFFSAPSTVKKRFACAPPFATRTEMENWERSTKVQTSDPTRFEMPSHKLTRTAICWENRHPS